MADDVVLYREEDKIAVITLNRPGVHNAVNREVMDRLETLRRHLDESATIRVVILTGAGGFPDDPLPPGSPHYAPRGDSK